MALALTGTVVTYDDDQPVVKAGAVYIGDDGTIDAVQPARRAAPAGFSGAPRVATDGVITPGLGISLDALVTRTAKLPRVELIRPPKVVGKNTVHAIQAGIVYGYASLVDGLVARIRDEIGAGARVIATGGFATMLAPESTTIEATDEFLTLEGLRLIHRRNQ